MTPASDNATVARLYQAATSSASWRVRIALALKAVAYESVWLDLHADDHLTDGYGNIAPTNQVPCLEIDGHRLFQSVAIIEYLDETRAEPALLRGVAAERAKVRSIVELVNSGIQPLHNLAVLRRLGVQFGASEAAAKDWCRYWIERRFLALDRLLARTPGKYACGDELTLADVFIYPQVMTSGRFAVRVADFPVLSRVVANLAELAQFRGSHAPGA